MGGLGGPANGTGHILDHVLVPSSQVKYVDHVRTVHQGRRGNAGEPLGQGYRHSHRLVQLDFWHDYTDHIPVESQRHYFPRWKPDQQTEDAGREKT